MLARAFVDFCDSVVRVMEQSSWQWARLYRLHQLHVAVQDVQVERRRERERDCVSVVGAITGPLSIYLPTLSHSHTHTHTQQQHQQQQLEHQTELLTARSDLFAYQVCLG